MPAENENAPSEPLIRFQAHLLDGRVLSEAECPSVDRLPLDQVVVLHVQSCSQSPGVPHVRICADLSKGERIHKVTRDVQQVVIGSDTSRRFKVEVYSVTREEKTIVCLYWHPDLGFILSSTDEMF